MMENVKIAATNETKVAGRWPCNTILELKGNHGFSFPDGSTKKTTVCVDLGNGRARWNYMESCIPSMDNY